MSYFKKLESKINGIVKEKGYDTDITLSLSNRRDLGEFQVNDAMRLAKIYHKNPVEIANEIKDKINIAQQQIINLK